MDCGRWIVADFLVNIISLIGHDVNGFLCDIHRFFALGAAFGFSPLDAGTYLVYGVRIGGQLEMAALLALLP